MKKVWKWIIGIVVVLIILGVLVGVGFFVRGSMHAYRVQVQVPRDFPDGRQQFYGRGDQFYGRGREMMPYGGFGHMRGFGMMGYGMNPFGVFFGGLFTLVFLALVVLGIIWLVRRLHTPKPAQVPAAVPAAIPAASDHPCQKCGRSLQEGWKVCPYCGKKV